jgi:uncharacterized protein YbaR (Trm112 family)
LLQLLRCPATRAPFHAVSQRELDDLNAGFARGRVLYSNGAPLASMLTTGDGGAVYRVHDRWFLDRIATHILAFEGESTVTFFDGNFSEYEEWRRKTLGEEASRPHRITYRKLTR